MPDLLNKPRPKARKSGKKTEKPAGPYILSTISWNTIYNLVKYVSKTKEITLIFKSDGNYVETDLSIFFKKSRIQSCKVRQQKRRVETDIFFKREKICNDDKNSKRYTHTWQRIYVHRLPQFILLNNCVLNHKKNFLFIFNSFLHVNYFGLNCKLEGNCKYTELIFCSAERINF